MNLARFLTEIAPQPVEGETDTQRQCAVDAWKHSDFICHGYVLNGLSDVLYNVYNNVKTSKDLWDALEKKYKMEDAGTKKFVVARFLYFKMVESKTVMNQVQEFQIILHDISVEGMTLSETFQVAAMIEKLPPSWVDFMNYLKHKRKEMSIEDLIVRLRIEEDNRITLKAALRRLVLAQICAMMDEVNTVTNTPKGWWVDTGATRHVCADKSLFTTFKALSGEEKLYTGNAATADIMGEGTVILKWTSGKELTLSNVLYVPDLRKNLVSGWLLNKFGFHLVFESD
ncbi:uncharacterized protein LOC110875347 [Helianthus annuus]|uniref:uncharacterized protein LOC110875347 n=1 Tax=Helianthus annuus TaxID=4232 RepID=UPI000B8F2CA9|nr:uncharacterized protein LOC110875347 [Helianthus annuus]